MGKTRDLSIDCYNRFSEVYDSMMNQQKYAVWKQLIQATIKKYQIPVQIGLDIGCGTGTISKMLEENGFQVIGVDRSSEMLKVANNKLPNASFYMDDIRDYRLREHGITLAVSFYDSLNYLITDEDMLACFRSTYEALDEGGIFLFDMNTRDHVYASQHTSPKIHDVDDCYAVFQYGGNDRIWTLDIDLFFSDGSGDYARHREHHEERGYDCADITPLLEKAGFTLLEVTCENKVYEDGIDRPSRLCFIARK